MKNLTTLITLLVTSFLFSQSGINYKVIIKDGSGNILANQSVDVQFIIYEGAGLINNVYQESHTSSTDANGLLIVNIGEGTTADVFADVAWGDDEHWLNVQVDKGAGLVDMGTTQFMAVPYALHAANVSGLEALDEGNGIGWRLLSRNSTNYDPIGFNSIDFSFVDNPTLGLGAAGNYAFSLGHNGSATGQHSFAFGNQNYSLNDYAVSIGNNNIVSGLNSTALGAINQVSGDYAFAAGLQNVASENYTVALGAGTTASGEYAVAMGSRTEAVGDFSFAFGDESEAQRFSSIAMGTNAMATSDYAIAIGRDTFASGESSFAVGYTTQATGGFSTSMGNESEASGYASTAMGNNTEASANSSTAMGNSTIASGSSSTAMGNSTIASGSSSIAMGNSTVASGFYSTAMGLRTAASGSYSTAMGRDTEASGWVSTAMGSNTVASEQYSTAMGNSTVASGEYATAMGYGTSASGYRSTAMGYLSVASGDYSTSMGYRTRATSLNSTAIGTYNIGGGSPDTWVETDRLFEIGNGVFTNSRNAFTVLKNGNVGIGTASPEERLHITGGRLRIGTETIEDTGTNRLSFNADLVPDTDNSFRLGNSTTRWTSVWAADGSINTSDRREKENIVVLDYGLKEIQKLKPVSFNWKKRPEAGVKLGLIAQDIQKVIPEVVLSEEIIYSEEDPTSFEKKSLDRLGVYYSDLIPVLIKAIQEQQEIIDNQKNELSNQSSKIEDLSEEISEIQQLTKRINQLENNQKKVQKQAIAVQME